MSGFLNGLENLVIMTLVVIHMWLGFSVRKSDALAGAIMSSASILGLVALHIWRKTNG